MFSKTVLTRVLRALLFMMLCFASLPTGDSRAIAAPSGLTLNVNNTADVPDGNPGDGKCETVSNNGICTLRAAIMEANASLGADTINLQAGATYALSRPGVDDDAYNGDLDITDKLTINGAGATVNGGGIDRAFDVPDIFVFVTIYNLTIRNGAASGDGGGIHNKGVLTLSNVFITQNHSSGDGGGAANDGSSAILVLENSSVTSNVGGLGGGGLFNYAGMLTLVSSTISGNQETSTGYGGGIENFQGTVLLSKSTVSSNTSAGNGGGIASTGLGSGGAVVTLINSTVANNTAASNGGGIYDDGGTNNAPATVNLYNVTIYGNLAVKYSGGGLSVNPNFADYVTLWNTLLADNRQGSIAGPLQDCAGTINSQDYNLIRTSSGCTIAGLTTHNKTNISALEGILWYNGGPTPTVALLAGSPAIEGGNPGGCIDNNGALLTSDQRGYLRPSGVRCDIGAFEYQTQSAPAPVRLYLPLVTR